MDKYPKAVLQSPDTRSLARAIGSIKARPFAAATMLYHMGERLNEIWPERVRDCIPPRAAGED
jgi:hypothetical protein